MDRERDHVESIAARIERAAEHSGDRSSGVLARAATARAEDGVADRCLGERVEEGLDAALRACRVERGTLPEVLGRCAHLEVPEDVGRVEERVAEVVARTVLAPANAEAGVLGVEVNAPVATRHESGTRGRVVPVQPDER